MNNGLVQRSDFLVPAAFLLAAGLAVGGWFVGDGFEDGRSADRFVTVKGVSERNVAADLALWPIRYVSTDDDLGRAQAGIEQSRQKVVAFLTARGIAAEQVEVQRLEVNDLRANPWGGEQTVRSRYIVTQTLMVRSQDPRSLQKAAQEVGALVEAGVVVQAGDFGGGPTFLFTRLNDLKPEMIAEATAEARVAAEQFARDSGSEIGKIRQANQGVFQILPRDRAPGAMEEMQLEKTVRVVSTVDYYLKD